MCYMGNDRKPGGGLIVPIICPTRHTKDFYHKISKTAACGLNTRRTEERTNLDRFEKQASIDRSIPNPFECCTHPLTPNKHLYHK